MLRTIQCIGWLVVALCLVAHAFASAQERILQDLASSDAKTRTQAIQRLAKQPPYLPVLESLTKALSDPALEVRMVAAQFWGVHALRYDAALSQEERWEKRRQTWHEELASLLEDGLLENAIELRREALRAMLRLSSPLVAPPLYCGTGSEETLRYVITPLLDHHAPGLTSLLLERLNDAELQTHGRALIYLTRQNRALVASALKQDLQSRDPWRRSIGYRALMQSDPISDAEILAGLGDTEEAVLDWVLSWFRRGLAVDRRTRLYKQCLATFPQQSVVHRRATLRLILPLEETYPAFWKQAQRDTDSTIRGYVLQRARRDNTRLSSAYLKRTLGDLNPGVRRYAVFHLGWQKPMGWEALVRSRLTDSDEKVRQAATTELAKANSPAQADDSP